MGLIRLLLAFAVVFSHSASFPLTGTHFVGGRTAVEAFFLISGFYMALVLETKYAGRTRTFYRNRFLRIYPTYWAALALALVVGFVIPSQNRIVALLSSSLSQGTVALLLGANLFIFGSDAIMFLSSNAHGLYLTAHFRDVTPALYQFLYIEQAWTLPVELTFYLLAPFVVRRPRVLVTLVVASCLIKVTTYHVFGGTDPWTYRFFPSELGLFCAGALVYHAYARLRTRRDLARWGVPCLAVMVLFTLYYERVPLPTELMVYAYIAALGFSIPPIFERFKRSRIDRELGELSYPIYVSHVIVIQSVMASPLNIHGLRTISILVCTVVTAVVLDRLVSRPVEARFKTP